ncbi:hypothetical protein ACFQH2_19600 [Natronoarchaeum sp. GCM10025703]|uniref:hypothetical protein n=1 Tax=Natronoarchaeum sp. GCM10025703 TaxID=3252685 RepID=UPI003607A9FF
MLFEEVGTDSFEIWPCRASRRMRWFGEVEGRFELILVLVEDNHVRWKLSLVLILHLAGRCFEFVAASQRLPRTWDRCQYSLSSEAPDDIRNLNGILRWVESFDGGVIALTLQQRMSELVTVPEVKDICCRDDRRDERVKRLDRDNVRDSRVDSQLSVGLLSK